MEALNLLAFDELRRAITVKLVGFAGRVEVEQLESRGWASVTFTGERMKLRVALRGPGAGEAADLFAGGLSEEEFDLRGHIVADIVAVAQERGDETAALMLEVLTVEDC